MLLRFAHSRSLCARATTLLARRCAARARRGWGGRERFRRRRRRFSHVSDFCGGRPTVEGEIRCCLSEWWDNGPEGGAVAELQCRCVKKDCPILCRESSFSPWEYFPMVRRPPDYLTFAWVRKTKMDPLVWWRWVGHDSSCSTLLRRPDFTCGLVGACIINGESTLWGQQKPLPLKDKSSKVVNMWPSMWLMILEVI